MADGIEILCFSGSALGEVAEGTTVTDWSAQERERGITIKTAAITTRWRDTVTNEEAEINLIDTPDHIDFMAEVQRSLLTLDGDVVIFGGAPSGKPRWPTPPPLPHHALQHRRGELTAGDLCLTQFAFEGGAAGEEFVHFGDDAFLFGEGWESNKIAK